MSKNKCLLNVINTREFIFNKRDQVRPGFPFTQISQNALDKIEAHMKNYIADLLHSHPTIGKTFNP